MNYVAASPAALLYYDYILTFNTEVMRFWFPLQFNCGTVLFLLNRYVAIFGHIPFLTELFILDAKEKQCHVLQLYHQCLTIIIHVLAECSKTFLFVIVFIDSLTLLQLS